MFGLENVIEKLTQNILGKIHKEIYIARENYHQAAISTNLEEFQIMALAFRRLQSEVISCLSLFIPPLNHFLVDSFFPFFLVD